MWRGTTKRSSNTLGRLTGVSLSSLLISFSKVMKQLSRQEGLLQLSGLGTIMVYILLYWVLTKFGKK